MNPIDASTCPDPTAAPRPGRRWASLRKAGEYACVSPKTLRRLRDEGRIRFYAPRGGRVLVDLDELDLALAACVKETTGQDEPQAAAACG